MTATGPKRNHPNHMGSANFKASSMLNEPISMAGTENNTPSNSQVLNTINRGVNDRGNAGLDFKTSMGTEDIR